MVIPPVAQHLRPGLAVALVVAAMPWAAGSAAATGAVTRQFTVNTTADAHDARPGDGRCADAAGRCTLRAAVEEADASPAGATIRIALPTGDYDLNLGTLTVGSPSYALTIGITGDDESSTIVDAGHRFRTAFVTASATVTIGEVSITGGNAGSSGYGGGILNEGTLSVFDSVVEGNVADAGGGIDNSGGALVVSRTTIEGNNGGYLGGGGIQNGGPQNLPGSVRVVSSTIENNRTNNEGGGIFSGQNGRPSTSTSAAQAPRPRCPRLSCRVAAGNAAGLTLEVLDSVISDNIGGNGGGGIAAEGPTQVLGSRVTGNSAGGAVGGGLFDVNMVRGSVISDNSASSGGGVEAFPALQMTIDTSTLDDNHVQSYGGAIENNGTMTIERSTLADNTAGGRFLGGGAAVILDGGAGLQMTNSTITGNTTTPPGGGALYNYGGSAVLAFDTFSSNSTSLAGGSYTTATGTIFGGTSTLPACGRPVHETQGYNLDSDGSCGLSIGTDLSNRAPKLGPLESNGGPTMTQVPLEGSPVIDHGGLPGTSGCPLFDQRGVPRPSGPACDIGSVEVVAEPSA